MTPASRATAVCRSISATISGGAEPPKSGLYLIPLNSAELWLAGTTTLPAVWRWGGAPGHRRGWGHTVEQDDIEPVRHQDARHLSREQLGAVPGVVPHHDRTCLVAEKSRDTLGNGADIRVGEIIRDHGSPSVGPEPDRVRRHRHHSKRTGAACSTG